MSSRIDPAAPAESGAEAPRRRNVRRALSPEQKALAEGYLPLARSLARRYKRSFPTMVDEFESAAAMALVEAAESFDPSRGVLFSTYARYRIAGALRDVQRRLVTRGFSGDAENAPRVRALPEEAEGHGTVLGAEPDPPIGADLEAREAVEGWLRKLPPRHAAACREIYLNGCTQLETARRLGCSQSRLSYMHREALEMLGGTWDLAAPTAPHAPEAPCC